MLDISTLVIVNSVLFVTMSLLVLVSRLTLQDAAEGALAWVVGDLLFAVARLAVLAKMDLHPVAWLDLQRIWPHVPSVVDIGALLMAGIWCRTRVLQRLDGHRVGPLRVTAECVLAAALWIGVTLAVPDEATRDKLLGGAIAAFAAMAVPITWRLSRRFWGARVILLIMVFIVVGKLMSVAANWSILDLTAPGEFAKMFLFELMMSLVLTMSFLVMLQERVRQQLAALSVSDPLTGLYNRRGLVSLLQRDLERARRSREPVSMVLFDLDHFKKVNDSVGHAAGDSVLKGFAACLLRTFRQSDLIGRWGGEEFVVVMPGADTQRAAQVAERVRTALRAQPLAGGIAPLTVSAGVAEADLSLDLQQCMSGLIAVADRRMYEAKVARDRICAGPLALVP